jgi:hypothetical protein
MTNPSPPPAIPLSYKAYTAFVTIACAVLCFLLLRSNAANRSLQRSASEAIERIGSAGLAAGEQVESLPVAAMHGGEPAADPSTLLAFQDGRGGTLLLLISGGCDTCVFSIPYFERLASLAEARGIIPVGVQLDAASEADLTKHHGPTVFPIVAVPSASSTWLRRVPIVPAIIVLDPRGVVTRTYFGELAPVQQDAIEAFISDWPRSLADDPMKKAPPPGP